MKMKSPFAVALLLTLFALLAGPNQSALAGSTSEYGRLIIRRSPVLGYNVTFTIYIGGRVAGTSVRARGFDQPIAPGRHLVVASPNRLRGDWRGIVDISPGQTYILVASYDQRQLRLDRSRIFP